MLINIKLPQQWLYHLNGDDDKDAKIISSGDTSYLSDILPLGATTPVIVCRKVLPRSPQ